jgi:FkbM family methyltransferase
MINRTKIKYALKKILPKGIFSLVVILWQKVFLQVVTTLDNIRLRKFTKKSIVHRTHRGHSFYLTISPENGFVDKHIYLYGIYEPFILDLFSIYLKKGDTFLDIGANIGQHSMFAGAIVGEHGRVHSFEPIPRIYSQLNESVEKNNFQNRFTLHNFALGDHDHSLELFLEKNNIGGSSFVEKTGRAEHITVHIKKGDDVLTSEKNISLVKIDVEGYEYEVLEGIHETLVRHMPVIILEFSYISYKNKSSTHAEKILSILTDIGYTLYDIEDNMNVITSHSEFLASFKGDKTQTNLLCLPSKK